MSDYIFKLPDLGEGTVEAEIAEWHVSVGDQVNEEDVLGAMMTDKAAVEVSSPVSGTVIALAGEPGDIVAVGAPLVTFSRSGDGGETATSTTAKTDEPKPVAPEKTPAAAPPAAVASGNKKVQTSPAVRRMAKETGVDLAQVPGSGPRGRILRADFERFVGSASAPTNERRSGTEEIKVIGIRRMIAEKMSASKRNIPHFSYVEELDITELEALRVHLNESLTDKSQRYTLLPFIAMAIVRATTDFPQANAVYDSERNVIIRHAAVHLGIATQTDSGLKVPVVRHAESLSIAALSKEIQRVSNAARDNSAGKDMLSGSTITLTSLGKLGGIASTPVINAPEVGIIGVNKAVQRPVVRNGQIEVRLMMNLSSSFDHRFVDGFDAAQMIQTMKGMLEHPATLFI